MMGVDFATAVAFVQPFEEHYARMTGALAAATKAVQADAGARAKESAAQAELTGLIAAGGATALGFLLAIFWIINQFGTVTYGDLFK